MAKLQIGIEINTGGDPTPEIRVTPVDVEVPDNVADAARVLSAYFDMNDAKPGDGEADIPVKAKLPIRFLFVKTDVKIDGNLFLRVKD
jgi:hypothetical protein